MGDVIDINELKKQATEVIEIPSFDNNGTISIRVKRPQIMRLITSGKLPNPLMGNALRLLDGKTNLKGKDSDEIAIEGIKNVDIYCRACMVEPTFEEADEYLTDAQKFAIFRWAINDILEVSTFRNEQKDDTDNNDGKDISKTTKRDTKNK